MGKEIKPIFIYQMPTPAAERYLISLGETISKP
jgi:hypothetical protein